MIRECQLSIRSHEWEDSRIKNDLARSGFQPAREPAAQGNNFEAIVFRRHKWPLFHRFCCRFFLTQRRINGKVNYFPFSEEKQ